MLMSRWRTRARRATVLRGLNPHAHERHGPTRLTRFFVHVRDEGEKSSVLCYGIAFCVTLEDELPHREFYQ
jgi:hypothetical protein